MVNTVSDFFRVVFIRQLSAIMGSSALICLIRKSFSGLFLFFCFVFFFFSFSVNISQAETIDLGLAPDTTLAFGTLSVSYYCHQFTPSSNLDSIQLSSSIRKDGAPSDIIEIILKSDNSGTPNNQLAYVTSSASALTDSYTLTQFPLMTVNLTSGTPYWICLDRTATDNNTDYPVVRGRTCSEYGGVGYRSDASTTYCMSQYLTVTTPGAGVTTTSTTSSYELLDATQTIALGISLLVLFISAILGYYASI